MGKGKDTKNEILKIALDIASQSSLESVTIGSLAKATNMSKSGLFAHFQSKENLQIAILEFAATDFIDQVVLPTLKTKAGITRIRALAEYWIEWAQRLKGGCIFVTASTEFSERPGKIRDFLLAQQKSWILALKKICRSAIRNNDLPEGIDCDQFAFDMYSLLMGYHYYSILLRNDESKQHQEKALERLLDTYQSQ